MKILISYLTKTNSKAIDSITYSFYEELKKDFDIKPVYRNRYLGISKNRYYRNIQAMFYSTIQYVNWIFNVIWFKPTVVHYPITSFSNFKKSMFFLLSAKFFGAKKTIGHLHGGAFKLYFENLGRLERKISIRYLNKLDRFIVLSSSWAEFTRNNKLNNNIEMVHNPIDKNFHDYFENSYSKQFENDIKLKLLYVGRLEKQKGFVDLVHSIHDLESIKLEILGDYVSSNEKKEIENILNEVKVVSEINYNGYLTGFDKILKFEETNVLVLPSYFENFPLVVLEAACASCAIIASKVGAIPDYFTDMQNIIFVEAGDVQSLKDSIKLLIGKPELVRTLGKNARTLYETVLNRDIAINKLKQIYKNI